MDGDDLYWFREFRIQSTLDLDFVIGQQIGWPVGMLSGSPPEFRRRVLAATISYQLQLKSIDHALKRYVAPGTYDSVDERLGDEISNFISMCVSVFKHELVHLHTTNPSFGQFGAEITLFRLPNLLDFCRIAANRGLLLEALPMFRLALEMMAWANTAFFLHDECAVTSLKAQSCITRLKRVYGPAGKLYGYLTKFAHWEHEIHGHILRTDEENISIILASVKYRAISLSICLVLIDIFLVIHKSIYSEATEK